MASVVMFGLEVVGFAILGLGVLVGAVLGLTWMISKAAVDITRHPWDCQCGPCQKRRLDAWYRNPLNRQRARDDRDIKPTGNEHWISTIELRTGMYVVGGKDRSQVYRVEKIEHTEFGYTVRLINARTRQKSINLIAEERSRKPLWLVMANEER